MEIHRLNVRIEILQNHTVVDQIGNHRSSWEAYYSCYATLSVEGGKEMTEAGMIVDDSTADFTVRWCEKLKNITSTGFRVRFQGMLYDILLVDHMGYRKKCMKLRCKKVTR